MTVMLEHMRTDAKVAHIIAVFDQKSNIWAKLCVLVYAWPSQSRTAELPCTKVQAAIILEIPFRLI